ncbi:MAG TPA: HEAT repeat domain-containing protein [Polyangiaceae bacterium]
MIENDSPLTTSPDDSGRMVEVQRLVRRGAPAVGALVGMLTERSWVVRRAVVAALARLGTPAVKALCETLRTDRANEARLAAAVDALVASAGDVEPHLLLLAESSESPPVLCDVAQVLGRRGSRASIPTLSRLVAHSDDNVAVAAIEALSRIGGPATVDALLAAVSSGNFFRTFPAIAALGQSGDARATGPLVALLDDAMYVTDVASAIARTGQLSAIEPLARVLAHADPVHAVSAANALAEIGRRHADRGGSADAAVAALRGAAPEGARERLASVLDGASPLDQIAIACVLGWLGDARSVRTLVGFLDAEPSLADAALRALATLGAVVESELRAAIRSGNSARRGRLLPLLAARRSALPELVECLADDDAHVRALACEALGRIGDTSVVGKLFELIGDRDPRATHAAISAIQSLGSDEVKRQALEAARSPDPRVRRSALRIVSYFGYPDAIGVLLEASADPDERIGNTAMGGLALLEDPRATAALLEATRHPSAPTRAAACRALGVLGSSPEVVASLRRALADADAWVRYYACQSLGRLAASEAASDVEGRLADEAGQVRVAAVEATAKLGGQRALVVLEAAARAQDPDVRRAALVGLGEIRRPEAVPILMAALASNDAGVRLVALSSIAATNAPEATATIMRSSADPDGRVRSAAIALLAERGGASITDWLIEQLSGSERDAAFAALANPTDGRIEGILLALDSASEALAETLIRALLAMRRPAGNAAVESALRLDNVHARRAAARGLTTLDTPEARNALADSAANDPDGDVRRISAAVRK